MKITLDAGHSMYTAGKRTPDDSMREFAFNSVVARYVAELLSEYNGVETFFVHDPAGTVDVPLAQRVSKANAAHADLYVSIHANAYGSGWNDANGVETYAAVKASAKSVEVAAAVQRRLVAATGLRNRGVKRADFYVIKNTAMPAILVEGPFMTNRIEAELLKSDGFRRKAAAAIVDGIVDVYRLAKKVTEKPEPVPTVTTRSATLSSVNVIVNGKSLAGGFITDKVTYVPIRALAEALGKTVAWDEGSRTVSVR